MLDECITALLGETYEQLVLAFAEEGRALPRNRGREGKLRELDCADINGCSAELRQFGREYDTVRGAFLEGAPAYPHAGFSRESHIQME